MATNGSLTSNQRRALNALLQTTTVSDAAGVAGLGVRTVYRYLTDECFRSELARRETALIDHTIARLAGELGRSVLVLVAIRDDVSASAGVRLRAALALIDALLRLQELRSVVARLERLEEYYYAQFERSS